jgi:DNA-binding CsgD family transcriptional regulator
VAILISRADPLAPRLIVIRADPVLGTGPELLAEQCLRTESGACPILDVDSVPGQIAVLGTEMLMDQASFADSDFVTVFLARYRLSRALALYLDSEDEPSRTALALFRYDEVSEFSDREKSFLWHAGPVLAHSLLCATEAGVSGPAPSGRLSLLTEREFEIAKMAALGARNEEIASSLSISSGTVKTHLRNIYSKLEVDSRVRLALVLASH